MARANVTPFTRRAVMRVGLAAVAAPTGTAPCAW